MLLLLESRGTHNYSHASPKRSCINCLTPLSPISGSRRTMQSSTTAKTTCLFMYGSPKMSRTSSISANICSRSFSLSAAVEAPPSANCSAKYLLAMTGGMTSSKVSAHSRLIALCFAGVGMILGGANVSPGKREERRERSSGGSSLGDRTYVATRSRRNLFD